MDLDLPLPNVRCRPSSDAPQLVTTRVLDASRPSARLTQEGERIPLKLVAWGHERFVEDPE